ncbi:MAG: GNAT family N-acetyltransferase [Desulfomonilia bacterium]|nr:GNAT family N-acetyltransferase [Desulfomonilia bacterium]
MKNTMESRTLSGEYGNTAEEISQANSIFQQPYWLEAVSPGQWGAAVVSSGGHIVARLPYVIHKELGLTRLIMPKLTKFLGPWISPATGKYASELARQKDIMFGLIGQLPRFDFFAQNFHYSITNWLPFYWKGFSQTTRYSYVLDDIHGEERLWSELQGNIRREIRKAGRQVEVRDDLGIDSFLALNRKTFARQGMPLPYTRELVLRIDAVLGQRNQRKIFFAEDTKGRIHAALYLIWDSDSAFYLMGGADPDLRNSGSSSLLMWEAIRFSSTVTRRFDFEGSMLEPIERFFRGFGARQQPFFTITSTTRRMRWYSLYLDISERVSKILRQRLATLPIRS